MLLKTAGSSPAQKFLVPELMLMKYSIALGSSKIAGSVHKTVKAHAPRRPVRSSAHEPLQANAQDKKIIIG
jgi:hypothetical protein